MDERDRRATIARYESRLAQHGPTAEALGWGKVGKQEIRFAALAEPALRFPESSVLDVGCGFADLFDYLSAHGWHGRYTGVDIVPALLGVARERHPGIDVRELDVMTSAIEPYDFAIASGVANARLEHATHDHYIERLVTTLFAHARVLAAADFLSTWVDFTRPEAWHTDPAWALGLGRRLTRRIALRHDYLPFEFALFLHRHDAVSPSNTFRAY